MYTDIYDDAIWLINLVENLLSVSRLEEGRMHLNLSTELIDEVVAESLRHVSRRSAGYHLKVQSGEEYLLAQIDAKLIVQVLINLIDNAIKYTAARVGNRYSAGIAVGISLISPWRTTVRASMTRQSPMYLICF